MYEFALPRVLSAYNIEYIRIFGSQKGYRNEIWPVLTSENQMINVTFFKREAEMTDRIIRADSVSEYLATKGLPTRRRIIPRILFLKNKDFTVNICVYNYLPGDTIPWESYTMERIKNLGCTMSNMHFYLSKTPDICLPSVYDEYLSIIKKMKKYYNKDGVKKAMNKKLGFKINHDCLDEYEKLLKLYKNKPGQQALHMDFVRGNILFEKDKISGILDFEKTANGHVEMDVSRTLAFLLVDCKYKIYEKVKKYFLYSGYIKRGMNKKIIIDDNFIKLVELFLFFDLYKFMLHNPYEYLKLNNHFVRTKDILVRYGVVLLKQQKGVKV